ncbi:hypothetical protein H7347_01460 [Corynebacterium sp. zg-331]|uniref:hypothetical protein n=1 Tax=unclassified Corynebacterium TaxID=2624378 RepID=UPI00128BD4FC|nr:MULTISPECIES: hypothetical protein [unclassified Corynebacterium]MBC3185255.1 hypothetical protein [Corynebacterium sp. zg-331]MPV51752.1 hypothetical protein [Corynebacterium sp. zg331]
MTTPSDPTEARAQAVRVHLYSMLGWAFFAAIANGAVILCAADQWWLMILICLVAVGGSLYHRKKIDRILHPRDAD